MSSLNLEFMGYVRSVRTVITHMRERGDGAVVLVVGDGLKPGYWEMTAGVANAAGINFASSVAEQYGWYGVRINTVNHGPVDTDRWDALEKALARDKQVSQERAHELAERSIPLGWICDPAEVAALMTFLASPRAPFHQRGPMPPSMGRSAKRSWTSRDTSMITPADMTDAVAAASATQHRVQGRLWDG